MSVIRVGSTTKYAEGWDTIFGAAKPAGRAKGKAVSAARGAASRAVKKKTVTKAKRPGKKRRG